jgi:catechol 2,3-dioxygenase-like lactoylglutathione lyase family enzyme
MKINFKRIDHVQLTIPKAAEERARKFYSGVLGLEEIEKPDSLKPSGGVWYKIGGAELHLGVEENSQKTKAHPAFEVTNLNPVRVHLIQNGIEIKEEKPVPGRNRFSFYDPFGNRIELLEFTETEKHV